MQSQQKYLKAPEKKRDKPTTFCEAAGDRKNEWSDIRCFEKEMEKAKGSDDERISIITRWMIKYKFTQGWQTWCIEGISSVENREKLRNIFVQDE